MRIIRNEFHCNICEDEIVLAATITHPNICRKSQSPLAVLTSFSARFSNRRGCISASFVTYVLKITLSFLRTDIILSLALTQVQ